MKNRLLQAYKQAPWRIQIQWIGLFLLGLVLIGSVTGLYLNISAQAATSGRRIQSLERNINNINNEIAQLTADLAAARSIESMKERAETLGFVMIDPHNAIYVEVQGFNPRADLELAPPRVNMIAETPILRSAYRISLWDWFIGQIWPGTTDSPPVEEVIVP